MRRWIGPIVLITVSLTQPVSADLVTRAWHIEEEQPILKADIAFYGEAAADSVLGRTAWGRAVNRDRRAWQDLYRAKRDSLGYEVMIVTVVVTNDRTSLTPVVLNGNHTFVIQHQRNLNHTRALGCTRAITVAPGQRDYTLVILVRPQIEPDDIFSIIGMVYK